MTTHTQQFPADYHTHTPLCRHAIGEPEEYIDQAIALNLAEYGISDHAPQTPEPFDDWRMKEADLPEYLSWINRARAHAGDRITVRAGLECDWLKGNHAWTEQLAEMHDWDYLIGSIHYVSDNGKLWDFDNPVWIGRWAETDVEIAWQAYWDEYAEMAASGLYDILGHPDLIKKFSYRPEGDLNRYYEPVIQAALDSGSAIELNMAGLYKPCAEAYPSDAFLKLAQSAGIPITLSSDAHAPTEVGRDFSAGIETLRLNGYTETCLFDKRKRSLRQL